MCSVCVISLSRFSVSLVSLILIMLLIPRLVSECLWSSFSFSIHHERHHKFCCSIHYHYGACESYWKMYLCMCLACLFFFLFSESLVDLVLIILLISTTSNNLYAWNQISAEPHFFKILLYIFVDVSYIWYVIVLKISKLKKSGPGNTILLSFWSQLFALANRNRWQELLLL